MYDCSGQITTVGKKSSPLSPLKTMNNYPSDWSRWSESMSLIHGNNSGSHHLSGLAQASPLILEVNSTRLSRMVSTLDGFMNGRVTNLGSTNLMYPVPLMKMKVKPAMASFSKWTVPQKWKLLMLCTQIDPYLTAFWFILRKYRHDSHRLINVWSHCRRGTSLTQSEWATHC